MKKEIQLDFGKKVFPLIIMGLGVALAIAMLVTRLNFTAVVCVAFNCILSALIALSLIIKKKVYAPMVFSYAAVSVGIVIYYIIWGADAGFGAFTTGMNGYASYDFELFTGEGNFLTRLLGNLLIVAPNAVSLWALFFVAKKSFKNNVAKTVLTAVLTVCLLATTVLYVLTMNLRSKPNTERLWEGHDDYLKKVDNKATKESPNVLIVMMDDLGYGDVSLNGAIYDTPNIDSIGENGLNFTNFYSAYSVCSPARFAALTGRYPYRGYADNVIYPTVQTITPFAQTRIFNSIEMGNNADGMLGDEITIAEAFKAAGYNTGAFGKWHLGDYGEYLPTNQGFDYFYGSHHVNDMKPFYHVSEKDGDWEIVHSTKDLKDQSMATKWIHDEISSWIAEQSKSDKPFFAYYASPWPHAPVFAGDDFDGTSGLGTYVDCVTEFDHYLGILFDEMEKQGVLEDTIIVFTSDNGPALEGSVGDLRGGKYLAYEGGQKVPFMIRWDNDNGALGTKGSERENSAVLVDLFPTLLDLCDITVDGSDNNLPTDRVIDGISMTEMLKKDTVLHTKEHPILHMKREKLKAIQYAVPVSEVTSQYPEYDYDVLKNNDYVTFKYFEKIQNDNSAFFDKNRKNWLHILTDDYAENYNRTPVYPEIADQFNERMHEIIDDFNENRRGIIEQ
ncbi:MAG: sulfatase-like hydrolase/transferase [Clostridia bacterium]|nr:sulfatase-like hydrolase/transferase [Clostridia bacterium]